MGGIKIKLLSIIVPAYNSQDYLGHCLDSVIPKEDGTDIEVIVVDDGSTDRTAEIARAYCREYPDIVRLVQKENGGHGSAVNKGIEAATGTYCKVVDSDDWLDAEAYQKVRFYLRNTKPIDLLVTNYVYEYAYNHTRKIVNYRNVFPRNKIISWKSMQRFWISQLMLMHSMIYRTQFLRDIGLKLPEHTFYVDNLFAYLPLPYVQRLAYLDCDLYRYFIGRPDQSVNTSVMVVRIDQQLRVTRLMITAFDLFHDVHSRKLRNYMLHYLSMMVAISIVHINLATDEETHRKGQELWNFIRQYDERLYVTMRHSFINVCARISSASGRKLTLKGLKIAKRIYKFS